MKITHQMIAEATGYTQSTVSKALNSDESISKETVAYIRRTAGEMGYYSQKRHISRAKKNNPFPQIAILVPEITSWFYSNILENLQKQIELLGGMLSVYITGFEENTLNLFIEQLNRLIAFDCIILFKENKGDILSEIPVIMITHNQSAHPSDNQYVLCLERGLGAALRHLHSLGHTRIGFLGEKNTQGKLHDFRNQMISLGLFPDDRYIYISDYRFERIGHDGIQVLHARNELPTGIICAYDEVAFGAIDELRKLQYRVPEDISVIGINNVAANAYFTPPLTTIQFQIPLLIQRITDIIQSVIIEEKPFGRYFVIPSNLIVRSTTAKHTSL